MQNLLTKNIHFCKIILVDTYRLYMFVHQAGLPWYPTFLYLNRDI